MNKYAFTLKLASAALQSREVGRRYDNAQQIATALAGIRKQAALEKRAYRQEIAKAIATARARASRGW